MKKIAVIVLITLIAKLSGFAQKNDKNLVIKSNVITVLTATPNIAIEAKTFKRTSVVFGGMTNNKLANVGATAWADYRFYLGYEEAPTLKGFYLASGMMVSKDNTSAENFLGLGGNIGYQWFDGNVKKNNLSLDFNFGLYVNTKHDAFVAALPKATVAIGWAIGE